MHSARRVTVATIMLFTLLAIAACGVPPDPSREQPRLSEFAQGSADALTQAGVTKIVSWSDRVEQPVQVTTRGGPIYFPFPRGLPLARFALSVDGGRVTVRSDDFDERNFDTYTASMRPVIAEALRLTRENNARLETREKASP
jgi:hypothetical protein